MNELVTISEAAKRLGVSVRTVQRWLDDPDNHDYTPVNQHGKRLVRLSSNATRDVSHDATNDATRDREGDTIEAEVLSNVVSRDATAYSDAFNSDATRDTTRNAGGESTLAIPESNVLALLADVVTARLKEERAAPQRPSATTAEKLLLSLDECQVLTGLSRQTLRAAITEGTLKASIIGRGFKVKRADLDRYIERL